MTKKTAVHLSEANERRTVEIEGVPFEAWSVRQTGVPRETPYAFDRTQLEELSVGIRTGSNVLLVGPTGCGKTSLPLQVAARLNQPCLRFNCDGETRVAHLRGQQRPAAQDGVLTLQFVAGALAEAMRRGWWVVLDELDAALPSVLFVLQSVLEEGNRTLQVPETNEVIEAHPDFRLFATSNTVGYRATARSRHAGTNMLNAAFVDRFAIVIGVDYPEPEKEIERVRLHVPGLVEDEDRRGAMFIDGVCAVAHDLRRDEKFRSDFSTRRCIQWARLIEQFKREDWSADDPKGALPYDVSRAFEASVARKIESPTDAKIAREVMRRNFAYDEES